MENTRQLLTLVLVSTMIVCVTIVWLGGESESRAIAQAQPVPDIQKQIKDLQEAVSRLSQNNPPVGTVMAYAGDWDRQRGQEMGWLLCDGSRVKESDYKELFGFLKPDENKYSYNKAEKTFELPNFQGVFLRGIDKGNSRDPDGGKRFVGDFQKDLVAKHKHHVKLDGGEHTHNSLKMDVARYDKGGDNDNDPNGARSTTIDYTPSGGAHVHDGHTDEDGGGAETRPKNCAVYWIIKFRSGPPQSIRS